MTEEDYELKDEQEPKFNQFLDRVEMHKAQATT